VTSWKAKSRWFAAARPLAAFFVLAAAVTSAAQAQTFTVLYNFTGSGGDGKNPYAPLLIANGNLYGTTGLGGTSNLGTIFRVTRDGKEVVLYSFVGGTAEGASPQAGLEMDSGGNLYGTTVSGGLYDAGTVFKLDTSGTETGLYNFTGGADGRNPASNGVFAVHRAGDHCLDR
jgi:uncharacterized repeat protein (TIGR03803 family)